MSWRARRADFDKGPLNQLFARLRKKRLIARQNFSCCSSCASYEVASEYGEKREAGRGEKIAGCVFYHSQDYDYLYAHGWVYLRYGQLTHVSEDNKTKYQSLLTDEEVGRLIIAECDDLGIHHEWNGSPGTAILIDLTRRPGSTPPSTDGVA